MGLATLRDVDAAQPQQAKLVSASAPIAQPPSLTPKIPAPGTALYETRRGDTVVSVARHYLSQTSYLTSSQLAEAIRGANGDLKGAFLKNGQQLTIPGVLDAPIAEKAVPVARKF